MAALLALLLHGLATHGVAHADVTAADAIIRAAAAPDPRRLSRLLEEGAAIDARGRHGETPLQAAAAAGRSDNVELLLKRGAALDEPGARGATALGWAARNGDVAMMLRLLDAGANPDAAAAPSRAPIAMAAARGQSALVELLLERGSRALEQEDLLRALLQAMAETVELEVAGKVAPRLAPTVERSDRVASVVAATLVTLPPPLALRLLDGLGRAGSSPKLLDALLVDAAERSRSDLVGEALRRGAKPDAAPAGRQTALATALARNDDASAALLVAAGADIDAPGLDAAKIRLLAGSAVTDRLALERIDGGGDVDAFDDAGQTTLFRAAARGDETLVQQLLARHADPSRMQRRWPGDEGWTALMIASANGHTRIVKALLSAGASVDARNGAGRTALAWAAWYQRSAIASLLLEAGADPLAADRLGLTPYGLAQSSADPATFALLQRAAARRGAAR